MSKKYVIEIKPEYEDTTKGVMVLGAKDSNLFVDTLAVEDLEELNSDYINEHFGELQDEAYQAGLNDAWEAARRIVVDTDHGGLALGTLSEIFGTQSCSYIMRENTAQQAIDKIKAYDGKHSDRIEVGDEVMVTSLTDGPLTVVGKDKVLDADGDQAMCYSLLSAKTGTVFEHDVKDHGMDEWETPLKTGRHFDHIDKLLEAMRT